MTSRAEHSSAATRHLLQALPQSGSPLVGVGGRIVDQLFGKEAICQTTEPAVCAHI